MSSWSLQLEGKVFDGVEVVPTSHVDMQDKILNPDSGVCRSVICLYVYGFESRWKPMIQYLAVKHSGCAAPLYLGVPLSSNALRVVLLPGVFFLAHK